MRTGWILSLLAMLAVSAPAQAQIHTVDPDTVIDGDLSNPSGQQSNSITPSQSPPAAYPAQTTAPVQNYDYSSGQQAPVPQQTPAPSTTPPPAAVQNNADTYERDDLIAAAEGVFGKGAEGLAGIIEDILHDQGQPNGYIAGREASGAFVLGLRYGSGTLFHKVEGQRPVYWTGPSVGFDVGGDATKVFVLVYNLYDTQDLYKRFPAAEGRAYFVGGFSASYLRRGDIVLIPVRLGVGWRLGANVGYMKFSDHQRWLPF
ncbi:DUF1134 domain-containing protein [Stakelama sp. CBK3Z-3]|uniref:DUF1134 domain-containing protein n=1 Tax=Stakelama flava TaxID=2860338 RepID=A0ABS6XK44_9SPHN|nr:DUF1134 domain-containing protein [Stakelama flava]MBW4330567.1 DUF1134 domain-containing protein [Stakelama flava]